MKTILFSVSRHYEVILKYKDMMTQCRNVVVTGKLHLDCHAIPTAFPASWMWSDGAMVLGKLSVPGRPTIWMIVGQGPIALAVGAGGVSLDILSLLYPFSFLSPSLWETARYRLKYCLKGPLSPKQPTNKKSSVVVKL